MSTALAENGVSPIYTLCSSGQGIISRQIPSIPLPPNLTVIWNPKEPEKKPAKKMSRLSELKKRIEALGPACVKHAEENAMQMIGRKRI